MGRPRRLRPLEHGEREPALDRAGGAGVGGFFTPTAYGTIVAEAKETRVIDGKPYVLEQPIRADFAFVHAWTGDRGGNLLYRRTARNSMIMWLHRPKRDVMQRWGEKAIVGWGRPAIWGQR